VRTILDELASTKTQIDESARAITALQREIARLKEAGKDVSEIRVKLSRLHTVHMQVLAVHAQLQKALKDIGA
jgi:hypothetical protein